MKRLGNTGRIRMVVGWLYLPLVLLSVTLFRQYPELIENGYSRGFYPVISSTLRGLTGWIPFSLGDVLYALFAFGVFRFLFVRLRRPWSWEGFEKGARKLAMTAGSVTFWFYLLWGMNYYRAPLEDTLGIEVTYTDEELAEFAAHLVRKTLHYQQKLSGNLDSLVEPPYDHSGIYGRTRDGYDRLRREWGWLRRTPHRAVKGSLYSTPLSYMGYGGYLNPFTNEAQVNENLPLFLAPVLSGHEAGHQLGFASEGDTNFIGQLVSVRNPDDYFKYSGYSSALRYVLSELSARDRKAFERLWTQVPAGVKRQYEELRKYREKYENPSEAYFEEAFDSFLKANQQADGIRSYNRVVGLLIGYHRVRTF